MTLSRRLREKIKNKNPKLAILGELSNLSKNILLEKLMWSRPQH